MISAKGGRGVIKSRAPFRISFGGGGGHLLVFCEPEQRFEVACELIKYDVKEVPFRFELKGLQTWRVKSENS